MKDDSEKKQKKRSGLVLQPFRPSTTVEGLEAAWDGGSVAMHAGQVDGEDILLISTTHRKTGNKVKLGMTVAGVEAFIKVGAQMLERLKADRAGRN